MSTWGQRGVPRVLRQRILDRDRGRCQLRYPGCTGVATEVDHIVNVARLGVSRAHATDEINLQSVCSACHRRKTEREEPPLSLLPTGGAQRPDEHDCVCRSSRTQATSMAPNRVAVQEHHKPSANTRQRRPQRQPGVPPAAAPTPNTVIAPRTDYGLPVRFSWPSVLG